MEERLHIDVQRMLQNEISCHVYKHFDVHEIEVGTYRYSLIMKKKIEKKSETGKVSNKLMSLHLAYVRFVASQLFFCDCF